MKTSRGAYRLMKMIFGLADEVGRFANDSHLKKLLDGEGGLNKRKSFQYLQRAGYIVVLGENRFEVTDLAKINLLKEIVHTRKPDGKLRIVIFDVPEKLKVSRDFFRRHLIELGFVMRQQSVWISKVPCEDLVSLVVKYHGLGKFVDLIVGELRIISSAAAE